MHELITYIFFHTFSLTDLHLKKLVSLSRCVFFFSAQECYVCSELSKEVVINHLDRFRFSFSQEPAEAANFVI